MNTRTFYCFFADETDPIVPTDIEPHKVAVGVNAPSLAVNFYRMTHNRNIHETVHVFGQNDDGSVDWENGLSYQTVGMKMQSIILPFDGSGYLADSKCNKCEWVGQRYSSGLCPDCSEDTVPFNQMEAIPA